MVGCCSIPNCKTRRVKNVKMGIYKFPCKNMKTQNEARRKLSFKRFKLWVKACRFIESKMSIHDTVCERHFIKGCPAKLLDISDPDWVPTLNMGHNHRIITKPKVSYDLQRQLPRPLPTEVLIVKDDIDINAKKAKKPVRNNDEDVANMDALILDHSYYFNNAARLYGNASKSSTQINYTIGNVDSTENKANNVQKAPVFHPPIGESSNKTEPVKGLNEFQRVLSRAKESTTATPFQITETLSKPVPKAPKVPLQIIKKVKTRNVSTQTAEIVSEDAEKDKLIQQYRDEIIQYQRRCWDLESKIKSKRLDIDLVRGNDGRTKYYTGLKSFQLLEELFKTLQPYLPESGKMLFTQSQMLMMTLQRLRLNLGIQTLADNYGISMSSVSVYLLKTLFVMYQKMKGVIAWPDRETFKNQTPTAFLEMFGDDQTIIVDNFEVKMRNPPGTYDKSKNRHADAMHVMIGMNPSGQIVYVSGATSNTSLQQHINEDENFLNNIRANDIIIGNNGTLVLQAFETNFGTIEILPVETESNSATLKMQAEVEKILFALRQKYPILDKDVPITPMQREYNGVAVTEMIIIIACALVNLSLSEYICNEFMLGAMEIIESTEIAEAVEHII